METEFRPVSGETAQLSSNVSPSAPVNRWAQKGGVKKAPPRVSTNPTANVAPHNIPAHPNQAGPRSAKTTAHPSGMAETYAVTMWSACKLPSQSARAAYKDGITPVATVSAAAHYPTVRRKAMAISHAVAPIAKRTAAAAPRGDWVNMAKAATPAEVNATPPIIQ